jgi:hypothetical protein
MTRPPRQRGLLIAYLLRALTKGCRQSWTTGACITAAPNFAYTFVT